MSETKKPAGIFTTNKLGSKILIDEQGEICRFQDSKSDVMETQQGLVRNDKAESIWFVVLYDKEKADRVRKLKTFGTIIIEAESAPMINQYQNLRAVSNPNMLNVEAIREQAKQDAQKMIADQLKSNEVEKHQLIADTRRYGVLSSQVLTKTGKFQVGVKEELKKEFELLESKLGIERTMVKEEAEA